MGESAAQAGLLLRALIAALSAAGLTMHKRFYAGKRRRDYWAYYTNLSNLAVLLYFTIGIPLVSYGPAELAARAEFAVMMSIMLTFCVFHFMMLPALLIAVRSAPDTRENRMIIACSLLQHDAVPLMTLAYWLLFSPGKDALRMQDAFLWLLFPIGYLVFVMGRGARGCVLQDTDSAYPYPFLDIERSGRRAVLSLCAAMLAACIAAGAIVIALLRLIGQFFA